MDEQGTRAVTELPTSATLVAAAPQQPSPPLLTYEQTSQVLVKLADIGEPIVLVGGQAVNFWANLYENKVPALASGRPYASKDIDFYGSRLAVQQCAKRLGGRARVATFDDMGTPNTGVVLFVDEDKHARQIDFLGGVAGLKKIQTVSADVLDGNGKPIASFEVMDPVMCLLSRAHNVIYLPGYQTTHAKNQLRAAIHCAKQFAREFLDSRPRTTLRINERIFRLAMYRAGPLVSARYGIDVMEAVVDEHGLPNKFYTERLPRVRAAVERARSKARAAEARAAAWLARAAR